MDWDRIEPYEHIVINVASEYHRKFNMVELSDIRQTLYQWFLEHPYKLDYWESIGPKDAKNLIYRSLRNQALDYCQYWKAKGGGYEVSDLFYYTPEMVETLLPSVLLGIPDAPPQLNLGKTSKPTVQAEGGNLATMLAEIDKAHRKLSEEDQKVIWLRFGLGLDYLQIVNELELNTEDAARQRVKRSIRRIVNSVGGYKPFSDEDDPAPAPIEEAETDII